MFLRLPDCLVKFHSHIMSEESGSEDVVQHFEATTAILFEGATGKKSYNRIWCTFICVSTEEYFNLYRP